MVLETSRSVEGRAALLPGRIRRPDAEAIVRCPSCSHENRDTARFCEQCAAPLVRRCASCGSELRPSAKFCDECGAPVTAPPAEGASARKVVTIVFADLIGSTALYERVDPESARPFMESYYRAMRGAVEAHGGAVTQLLGDGVKAVFGVPRVAEDDAIRAVRAGVEMQRAFRELAAQQSELVGQTGLRVAVNTGEVLAKDESEIIGDPVNVAARLQEQARDGDVVIGEATHRLVASLVTLAPLGSFALKGRYEAVEAYRVTSLERPAGAATTAFVGREAELARITRVYEAAAAAPGARLAVILGSPGLGKSRLLAEFAHRLGPRATVLAAHCNAAGGSTFAPLAEALRAHLGIEAVGGADALRAAIEAAIPAQDAERSRISAGIAALLLGTPASPEETFFVVRRLLAVLAAGRPMVLAIDDLQWAEPLLLDLTEHLVQWGAGVPMLVLAAARPELRDARSSLASPGSVVSDVVTLSGLDAGAATRLAAAVIGADALPAAVAGRVLATSEGNPLFLGELVRMLVNDGALRREGDRWTTAVELADLEMPPTIQALLAARIERLRAEDRLVLERAAVIGRQFSRAAVAHLLPRDAQGDLDARFESLRRSELIERDTGWLLGEPALRFHHVLIRDAAYRRLLRNTRAELHARFAEWLEGRVGESIEHGETIGWHLEQAYRQLLELGPLDAAGRALGERAAKSLAAAGRRALARDDLPPAGSLLGRALDLLDAADPARAELALDWCEALLSVGDVARAEHATRELARVAEGSERLRAWHTCFVGQLAVLTDPQALRTTTDAVAAAAATLAGAGDAAGEAKAHAVHALSLAQLGQIGASEAALDRALAAARRARDRRRANAVLAGAPVAALWGPSPVTRASGRCLDVVRVLRITQGAPAVEAVALRCQAVLETLRGRAEAARRMIASSRRMVEELGITQRVLEADLFAGMIELLEGDAPAAERWLRSAWDGLRAQGLDIDAAQAAALLGRALLAQGRVDEAEAMSRESEALAGDSFKAAIAWRGVRAEVLAARGEHASAIVLARAAVGIAAATDDLLDHADARQSLAVALRASGRRAEADAEERRAIELWETKGATLLVERARARLGHDGKVEPALAKRDVRKLPARGVHRNRAVANIERLDAAMAAADIAAVRDLCRDDVTLVHHPTGAEMRLETVLHRLRGMLVAENFHFRHQPIAAIGEALALFAVKQSLSALPEGDIAPFGPSSIDSFTLIDVDASDRTGHAEIFADNRLADAIVRLYERHAELLPDGQARARATATARTVAAILMVGAMPPIEQLAVPDVEFRDHRPLGFPPSRGAAAVLQGTRSLLELAEGVEVRVHDVLALQPDGFVLRSTTSGTQRESGGHFDLDVVQLRRFAADGRLARVEFFAPEHGAEALGRFEELAAPAPVSARQVRHNHAVANVARLDALMAARDVAALPDIYCEDAIVLHHPTAGEIDLEGILNRFRSMLAAESFRISHRPLASLGDSLALCAATQSFKALAEGDIAPFGPASAETFVVVEADASERTRRVEVFADNHLGDAVVRLYERYAELLPEGRARAHATATARTVAAILLIGAMPPIEQVMVPDAELRDDRPLGFGSYRGAARVAQVTRSLLKLAERVQVRVHDVLALQPDGFVLRSTTSGTQREGGGHFDLDLVQLRRFSADGRLARVEFFEREQGAEALARFDELEAKPTASIPAPVPARRVRPNLATASAARMDAAVAAHDLDAFLGRLAPGSSAVHHPTGAVYEEREAKNAYRAMLAQDNLRFAHDPIAALGERLALCHGHVSFAQGNLGGGLDPGASDMSSIVLLEVDANGLRTHTEFFATDRLADAVVRLYERHAELLPEGPERVRAAATARSFGALFLGPASVERYATALAPDIEHVDHRTLGFGSGRGAERVLRAYASLFDLAQEVSIRVDDVLELRHDALLARGTTSGRDRASGGSFSYQALGLWIIGPDGLGIRNERWDARCEDEARARLAELLDVEPAAERFANAAVRAERRMNESARTRDFERFAASIMPEHRTIDRRRSMQVELGRDEMLAGFRPIYESAERLQVDAELIATRGERLALFRERMTGAVGLGGPSEVDFLRIIGVDERGELVLGVVFDPDDLDAAYAELDARYAAGEGAPYARLLEHLTEFRRVAAALEPDAMRRLLPDDFTMRNHMRFATTGEEFTRDRYAASMPVFRQMGVTLRLRLDHLRVCSRAAIADSMLIGSQDGGDFERPQIAVFRHDGERVHRLEIFDADELEQALARYAELSREPAQSTGIANEAVRGQLAFERAWSEKRWDDVMASFLPTFQLIDRRSVISLDLGGEEFFTNLRLLYALPESRWQTTLLATRGERHTLAIARFSAGHAGGGRIESEHLTVTERDAEGRSVSMVLFDLDACEAAWAELEARYHAGEAAPHARVAASMRAFHRAFADRSWAALAAQCAPELEVHDHRLLGWESLHGRDAYVLALHSLVALAPDTKLRLDHVTMCERGYLVLTVWDGTHHGGAFDAPSWMVAELDAEQRIRRFDQYDLERADEARARFAAVAAQSPRPDPLRIPPNTATRTMERFAAAADARDWETLASLLAPEFRYEDRRSGLRDSGDRAKMLESVRVAASSGTRTSVEILATAGERLALRRLGFFARDGDQILFEVDTIQLDEVDGEGRYVSNVSFDPGDRGAAAAELRERYFRSEAARFVPASVVELGRALDDHDLARARVALDPGFVFRDHRRTGIGQLEGTEAYLALMKATFEQTPDGRSETLYVLAEEPHGTLNVGRTIGTLWSGGPFENVFARIHHYADGRHVGTELFEITDLERARARFEELRPR
jgi:class 3 adenylate cyclase/ketosteroid isomerase-like protein